MKTISHQKNKAAACILAAAFGVGGLFNINSQAEDVWLAPPTAAQKENPVPAAEASLVQGKKFYNLACAACHGSSGKGDGPAATALTPKPKDLASQKMWEQSDGALFWKISEGKTPMPPFGTALSAEQRWSLVNYLRTLAPKPAHASVGIKPEGKP